MLLTGSGFIPSLHFQINVSKLFPLSCTRLFLLSSTTATGSPWKPLRDIHRGGEMEKEKGQRGTWGERGRHERLGCYHAFPPQPPKTPTSQFNAEPPAQTTGPPFTYLCLPRTLSPSFFFSPSIPLLSRQTARMAGMETFTDGSTGKFSSHPQKANKQTKQKESNVILFIYFYMGRGYFHHVSILHFLSC